MKVVLVAGSFPPGGGGAERQMLRVLSELRERGWEVLVLARWLDDSPREYVIDGVAVIRVGPGRITIPNALRFTIAAARRLARERADVVVALQAGSSPAAAAMASVVGLRRVPFVLRLTGNGAGGHQLGVRGASVVSRWATRAVLRSAAAIASPAQHLLYGAGRFQREVDHKGVVIPNGAPVPPVAALSSSLDEHVDIAWVGRPVELKNYAAFVELARRCPDLSFVSVGPDASLSEGLPNLTSRGWLPDASAVIARARAVVSTSKSEGSPNVVIEALAAGVPVVAFDLPGIREVTAAIRHGVRIVDQGDLPALEAQVRATLADPRGVEGTPPTIAEVADLWADLLSRSVATSRKHRPADG